VKDSTLFGDIYLEIYFMKLTKLVQESVPKKRKRIKLMITESQLKSVINKTVEIPNIIKKSYNEKK
jgi:hypothetical protein